MAGIGKIEELRGEMPLPCNVLRVGAEATVVTVEGVEAVACVPELEALFAFRPGLGIAKAAINAIRRSRKSALPLQSFLAFRITILLPMDRIPEF